MVIYGIAFGMFSPPNTNVIMGLVLSKNTLVASAAVATMRTSIRNGYGMLPLVFVLIMSNVPIIGKYYPLLTQNCQITCLISVILCIMSVFASLVGIKSSVD